MIRCFTRTCVATAFVAAMPSVGLAQNEADVLRYGWVAPLGSSRTMAMGGAFGALGADLGSMGINPAGLGLYRRGDLAIATGLNSANTDANWNTSAATSAKFQGTTGNLGVALTYPSVDADWPFFTLAVGRQVRMPFNQRIFIEGVPSESTVSDLFVQQALDDAAIYGYATGIELAGRTGQNTLVVFNTADQVTIGGTGDGRGFEASILAPFATVVLDSSAGYVDGFVIAKSFAMSQNSGHLQLHAKCYADGAYPGSDHSIWCGGDTGVVPNCASSPSCTDNMTVKKCLRKLRKGKCRKPRVRTIKCPATCGGCRQG